MRSSEIHHPKVESYGDYLYLILHGIDFREAEHCFKTQDVDFFLGEQFLVTVHPGISRTLTQMRGVCPRNHRALGEGPGRRSCTASSTRWSTTTVPKWIG